MDKNFSISRFNNKHQFDVQEMVIEGLMDTAHDYGGKVIDGVNAYLQKSLSEDLGSIESYYSKRGSFFIAEHNGDVIGSLGAEVENKDIYRLKRLSVKKLFRKNGVAEALLSTVEEWIKKQNGSEIIIGTSEVQKAAVKFWQKSGFVIEDINESESGIKLYSMRKFLRPDS